MPVALDILGPASAPYAVTARPSDTRGFGSADTWFADCSSPSANDGTVMQASFANAVIAQLRTAIDSAGVTRSNVDDAMLWKAMQAAAAAAVGVPIGMVGLWLDGTLPTGFVKLNGATLSRSSYAALWALANGSSRIVADSVWTDSSQLAWTSWSSGDGVSTFRLPDFRGEFPRFWDDGRGVDLARVLGLWQEASLLGISTTSIGGWPAGNLFRGFTNGDGTPGTPADMTQPSLAGTGSETFKATRTRPRNVAIIPIIRAI